LASTTVPVGRCDRAAKQPPASAVGYFRNGGSVVLPRGFNESLPLGRRKSCLHSEFRFVATALLPHFAGSHPTYQHIGNCSGRAGRFLGNSRLSWNQSVGVRRHALSHLGFRQNDIRSLLSHNGGCRDVPCPVGLHESGVSRRTVRRRRSVQLVRAGSQAEREERLLRLQQQSPTGRKRSRLPLIHPPDLGPTVAPQAVTAYNQHGLLSHARPPVAAL